MARYKYHYTGEQDLHLPLHGISVKGGDPKAVYESDSKILHSDFELIDEPKRKEHSDK